MKYHEMTKNYIFREFECGLTKEQTAELCFKSVRTVTEWDRGKTIPPECRRLMRLYAGRSLSIEPDWEGFIMRNHHLELPTGKLISSQEIILGAALLELGSETDLIISRSILKYVRTIERIKRK